MHYNLSGTVFAITDTPRLTGTFLLAYSFPMLFGCLPGEEFTSPTIYCNLHNIQIKKASSFMIKSGVCSFVDSKGQRMERLNYVHREKICSLSVFITSLVYLTLITTSREHV